MCCCTIKATRHRTETLRGELTLERRRQTVERAELARVHTRRELLVERAGLLERLGEEDWRQLTRGVTRKATFSQTVGLPVRGAGGADLPSAPVCAIIAPDLGLALAAGYPLAWAEIRDDLALAAAAAHRAGARPPSMPIRQAEVLGSGSQMMTTARQVGGLGGRHSSGRRTATRSGGPGF